MIPSRLIAAFALILAAATPSSADVLVVIDKSAQELRVVADGALAHVFKTSTGIYGTGTPIGSYKVERLNRHWYSRKYGNAPMPYSIFFHGAYAIHGTTAISRLGNPASHGCVRLHPRDAAVLFALVQSEGADKTSVIVTGVNPPRPVAPRELSAQRRKRAPQHAVRNRQDIEPVVW
jgi:lipoprotein-anchoring transpeptidase ErfK/SrfK